MNQVDLRALSPWSRYNNYQEVEIGPASRPINGKISIPGAKAL